MPTSGALHVAIDLGAGSGRALVGSVSRGRLLLEEVHRFHYGPRQVERHLRWDMTALVAGLRHGFRNASAFARDRGGQLVSAGVDSWGVDYGLVDENGHLLEEPISYRDARTAGVMEQVFTRVSRAEVFDLTGIQSLPLNTLFQLYAHVQAGLPAEARGLLMIPDLCHHALCGSTTGEVTNASTTQLLDVRSGRWADALFDRLGLPRYLMPDLVAEATPLGTLDPAWQAELDLPPLGIVAPATHDTASAVAATPLDEGWAYVSSGTWSLVGVELPHPVTDAVAGAANFTNERGVGGTTRFLKNVMGLWMLECCRREWADRGQPQDLAPLVGRVAALPGVGPLVCPDDLGFFNPPSMLEAIGLQLGATGQPASNEPARVAKTILDSLALRYASVVEGIERLTGRPVPGVHIVGGGSQNDYLNQATADATGRPVAAGPVEATAVGNLIVQAMAAGEVASLADARASLRESVPLRRFTPRPSAAWQEARRRFSELEAAVVG